MNSKLRLCIVCNEYPPSNNGGIGTVSHELAEGLTEHGFEISVIGVYNQAVLALKSKQIERINGVKIIRLPTHGPNISVQLGGIIDRLRLYWWISREHKKNKYDFIEVPDYEGMLPWGSPSKIPIICRGHGSAFYFDAELRKQRASRLIYYFEKRNLKKADHLIFVSRYTAKISADFRQSTRYRRKFPYIC